MVPTTPTQITESLGPPPSTCTTGIDPAAVSAADTPRKITLCMNGPLLVIHTAGGSACDQSLSTSKSSMNKLPPSETPLVYLIPPAAQRLLRMVISPAEAPLGSGLISMTACWSLCKERGWPLSSL